MAFNKTIYDIKVDQFDYGVNLKFNLTNPEGTTFDLTGYDAEFILKANKDDDDSKAIANVKPTLEEGVITVPIDEKMASCPVGKYYYAIRLIGNGYVNTIIQAKYIIENNTFESGVKNG